MSGRDEILGRIRAGLGRGALEGARRAALEAKLANPPRNLVPARAAALDHADQVELFIEMAGKVDTQVTRVKDLAEVPGAIADYLAQKNLPTEIRRAPHPLLDQVPWQAWPTLSIQTGRAEGADAVGVGAPLAGVAETGTLAYASGPESPATVNFLPETHIAVLRAKDVVAAYEDVFARVREKSAGGPFPRTVNFITGPSRTADIELTLILGAHGPKRLHIVLVDDGEG